MAFTISLALGAGGSNRVCVPEGGILGHLRGEDEDGLRARWTHQGL